MSKIINKPFFSFIPDKATIKKSAINSLLVQIIIKLKGIITMPILTYLMMPKEIGIFNIILITSSLLTPFFILNLPDGCVLFFAQEESQKKIQDMYMTVLNTVILCTIFLTLAISLFIFIFKNELFKYVFWVALILCSRIFYQLAGNLLATYQKTNILLKNAIFRDIGISLLSILLVYLGYSYKGLVIASAIFFTTTGFCLFRIVFKNLSYSFSISISYLKSFLKMSLPLLPVFFFSWVILSSDSYFLVHFKGTDIFGKYSVIYGLCSVILVLTFALNFFWFPLSAKLWKENREKYRKGFMSVFSVFSAVLLIAVLLFEFNSKVIMKIFARKSNYQDAYVIMGIIAFAFAMQVLITLLTAPLYSNKNAVMIFFSFLFGGLINATLNFILIPSTGLLGAAISTAVSYLIVVAIMSYSNYKKAKFSFFDNRLFYVGGFFIFLWPGVAYLREYLQIYQLLIGNVVLLLLIGSLLYFKIIKKNEKQYIYSFFKELRLKSASKA